MTEKLSHQPTIIDYVPKTEELRRIIPRRRSTYEYIDPVLMGSYDTKSVPRPMVERFADKLHFAGEDAKNDIARDAYGIARQLGDDAIERRSEDAFAFLDLHRSRTVYNTVFTGSTEGTLHEHAEGFVSRHKDAHGTLRNRFVVDIAGIREDGKSFLRAKSYLAERGVAMNSHDLSTLLLLQASGHEAGHLIQNGLISTAEQVTGEVVDKYDSMAAIAVSAHPESDASGDLKADARRYNERFAEGYGMLVMSEAARALGYDDLTVDALEESVKLAEEKDVGNTGYSRPLDINMIVEGLETVNNVFRGEKEVSISQDSYMRDVAEVSIDQVPPQESVRYDASRYQKLIHALFRVVGVRPPR